LLTRFGNAFTKGNNNQSNFRYQAGLLSGSVAPRSHHRPIIRSSLLLV